MNTLEKMDKFLQKYNFPKLNQEEMQNLNRHSTSTEIESEIFQQTKAQDQMASQLNSTKNLEKNLSYSNSSRNLQRKVNFQSHSMRPSSA